MQGVLQFLTLLLALQNTICSKILGVFHFPIRSHHILGSTLLKALADKGHEVTMISAFPLDKPYPNYTDIVLSGVTNIADDPQNRNLFKEGNNFFSFDGMKQAQQYMNAVHEFALNHTAVKQLISSKERYDAVIQIYFANDAYLGLAHQLEASSILFSPIGSSEMTNSLTRNPSPLSYTPSIILGYPDAMSFWQRVINVVVSVSLRLLTAYYMEIQQTALLNTYFPSSPSLQELRNNVSLVLLNSHLAIEGPKSFLPNMIPIGGFHVQPPQELTGELKDYMDSASNGVILFSLGSNAKSSELSQDKINVILYTFAALPQKILWKFEGTRKIPNVPSNVKILKWLPQRDILAHPNLKAFITHGGLLSTIEAHYNGVPLVGIPVYGDQFTNVNQAVYKGVATKVDLSTMTLETFSWAIMEVTGNPRYREAAQTLARILKDNPISQLEKAVYWVEYVVKHKGAHHLKSVAINLEWYELYSLDVLGFLLGIFFLTSIILCYIPFKMLF